MNDDPLTAWIRQNQPHRDHEEEPEDDDLLDPEDHEEFPVDYVSYHELKERSRQLKRESAERIEAAEATKTAARTFDRPARRGFLRHFAAINALLGVFAGLVIGLTIGAAIGEIDIPPYTTLPPFAIVVGLAIWNARNVVNQAYNDRQDD